MAWGHLGQDAQLNQNAPVVDDWFAQFNGSSGSATGIDPSHGTIAQPPGGMTIGSLGSGGFDPNSPDWNPQHGPEWRWSPSNPSGYGGPNPMPPSGPILNPSPNTGGAMGGAMGGGNAASLIQQWQQSHPANAPDLPGLVRLLQQNGINAQVATHGVGNVNGVGGNLQSDDKILINGQVHDIVIGSHSGGNASWGVFDPNQRPSAGGGGQPGGGTLAGGLSSGYLAQPFSEQFKAPTADEFRNTPGYQFTRDEGLHSLQSLAAAKGTLLTGGLVRGAERYASGLADQTYQQGRNNAYEEYMGRFGIDRANKGDIFSRYYQLGQWGQANPGA